MIVTNRLRVWLGEGTRVFMLHLQNLNDLELGVHDHDVFSLRFSLGLDHVSLRLMSGRRWQQAASSQHHLGHQLPHSMDGLHHIAASYTFKMEKMIELHSVPRLQFYCWLF